MACWQVAHLPSRRVLSSGSWGHSLHGGDAWFVPHPCCMIPSLKVVAMRSHEAHMCVWLCCTLFGMAWTVPAYSLEFCNVTSGSALDSGLLGVLTWVELFKVERRICLCVKQSDSSPKQGAAGDAGSGHAAALAGALDPGSMMWLIQRDFLQVC